MNAEHAALITCEAALDPLLEQLAAVLDEHSANFAGPIAEVLERLRSAADDASVTISAALLESLGPIPPRRRWTLVEPTDPCVGAGREGRRQRACL